MSPLLRAVLPPMILLAGWAHSVTGQTTSYEELQRFSAVLNHVRTNYVDSVTYNGLVKAAITGMLEALDPHSWFASKEDADRLSAVERGELAVTGILFEIVDRFPTVLSVVSKSPAEKAGIQSGDRITAVDGIPTRGLPEKSVALRLAGDKGSSVELRIQRGPLLEPDSFSVRLKRAFLERRYVSVAGMVDVQTGYVRLEMFGPDAADEVVKAMNRLRGMKATRMILDLRGNPGGIVTEAVDLAAAFLPAKTLVFSTTGRKKAANEEFRTKGGGDLVALPLVILIDRWSASASEAVAGSLQDHDRALIVGRRSFGKALMQTDFFVPNGQVHLTIGHVLSPSGRFIQRRYQGLAIEQYYAFAGNVKAEDDTLKVYRTDHGREVRGGGGIAPDVAVPPWPDPPVWWSVAVDSGFTVAVADSVAATFPSTPAGRAAWLSAEREWQDRLLPPFLDRVRSRLKVTAQVDSSMGARMGRILAWRVAEVRWGPEAGIDLMVRTDRDVQAALEAFPRIGQLLGGGGSPAEGRGAPMPGAGNFAS